MLLNPRRTRTNMKLLQLVSIFLLPLCGGQSAVTTMQVKEDDDAVLNCSFGTTNMENGAFDWKKDVGPNKKEVFFYSQGTYYGHGQTGQDPQFEGRVFHFPHQLQFGNVSIKIKKAKTSDSGTYSCYSISPRPQIRSSISLTVDPILKPRPEIEGASPQPIVTLHETNNGVLLQCAVRGASPKPRVEWWDSDGNILPDDELIIIETGGNKYDVILNATVTKTGDYRCVATQKEINHQIYTKTHVPVPNPGAASKPYISIVEETKDGVLLQCEVFGASPELKVFWKDKDGNLVPSKEPQKIENTIILQTTVTKTDYYRCVTTEGKMDDEVFSEFLVRGPEEKPSGVVPVVVSVFVTAVIVGVAGIVIGCRCKSISGGSTRPGML